MTARALRILPLASAEASLDLVGGKGRALAAMAGAGLPVPEGFVVTAPAYRAFVQRNELGAEILASLSQSDAAPRDGFERASARIRALFESGSMDDALARSIRASYTELCRRQPGGQVAVSVRSSATAEDLPHASFAGQQDTYLHVRGAAEVLRAVRRCWASLWTARAIGYRTRLGIDPDAVAMGVAVQCMVESEVSGVLFTCNPVTGDRSELVVNAIFVTVHGFAYCRVDLREPWRLLWTLPRLAYWYVFGLRSLVGEVVPRWRDEALPAYLATVDEWHGLDPRTASDARLLVGMRALARADACCWFEISMVMGMAKVTDWLLDVLRGGAAGASGAALHAELERYLATYGHTVYTLDFVQPTQAEAPLPVLLSLQALVADGDHDIVARQSAMVRQREQEEETTAASLGPLRRWLFRKLLAWAQRFGPHREEALFYMGAGWPTLRQLALELGQRLADAGLLPSPDDVFYLQAGQIEAACAARAARQAHPQAARQAALQRQLRQARMRLHPPGMIPPRGRFKLGPIGMSMWETHKRNLGEVDTLEGFAVSPGTVTGQRITVDGSRGTVTLGSRANELASRAPARDASLRAHTER